MGEFLRRMDKESDPILSRDMYSLLQDLAGAVCEDHTGLNSVEEPDCTDTVSPQCLAENDVTSIPCVEESDPPISGSQGVSFQSDTKIDLKQEWEAGFPSLTEVPALPIPIKELLQCPDTQGQAGSCSQTMPDLELDVTRKQLNLGDFLQNKSELDGEFPE